jgi:2-phospho-L-lactate/phosphoenolpyruvate guanylyltransferase
MILIPVKNLGTAKQRLAAFLDQDTRTELAQTMLLDVLETLHSWNARPQVAVVTSDSYAVDLAKHFHFEVIDDPANRSETDAIERATEWCLRQGIGETLVIPADIPLIAVSELAEITDESPEEGSVLVPAADGRGTNAVLRRPANLFPLRFGNNSFNPHVAAARATGKSCHVIPLPGIGLDVDNPADLRQLVAAPGEKHSQKLARAWNLSDFPAAANQ